MTLEFYSIWWMACDDSAVATKPAQAGSKSQGRAIPGGAREGGGPSFKFPPRKSQSVNVFQKLQVPKSVTTCFPPQSTGEG